MDSVTPEVKKDTADIFFRIHFSKNEEILEDLLPKLKKFNFKGPLPGRVRSQLDDSGPCIVLLNKILEQPDKYKPTAEVKDRAEFLWSLYTILLNARRVITKDIELKSLMSAIIAYHKKETTYPQVFKVIVDVTKDIQLTKDFMIFLSDKAIHYSMPYQTRDSSSDEEFMFDEPSDGESCIQSRSHAAETTGDIIAKANSDNGETGQWALSLFLDGVMTRDDLQMFCPSLENSKLEADPVAAESYHHITQLLRKDDLPRSHISGLERIPESYVVAPREQMFGETTGASIFEEFVETRKYFSTFIMRGEENTSKTHPNIDAAQSLAYVVGACEILHDQEIDSDIFYNATLDVQNNNIHQNLLQPLSELYGIHRVDEIVDLLKSANETCPAVCESMKDGLVKYGVNHYRSMNSVYVRLTQEAVRWFPHPEILPEALEYLSTRVSNEILSLIANIMDKRGDDEVFEMEYLDILYITKFSKYYKLYLRKFHPMLFIEPPLELIDSSIDWCVVYESFVADVLSNRRLEESDLPEEKYTTPILDKLLAESAADLMKDIYPTKENLPVKYVRFVTKRAGGEENILALEIVSNK